MSGRSPDQLAREVRAGLAPFRKGGNHLRSLAALAELQAQAEAGQRLQVAARAVVDQPWRHISEVSLQELRAAAVPSPEKP